MLIKVKGTGKQMNVKGMIKKQNTNAKKKFAE